MTDDVTPPTPPLQWMQAQARALLAAVPDGVITIDATGRIRQFNPAAEELFGYEEAEVIGRKLTFLMPEIYRVGHEEGLRRRLKGEPAARLRPSGTFEGMRRDGSHFFIELSLSTWHANGETYFTGVVRDVSVRRDLERHIRRLAQVVQSSNDAMICVDLDGNITEWNPGAERLFGWTANESIGHPISMLASEARQAEQSDLVRRVVAGEHVGRIRTQRKHRSGELVDVAMTMSLLVGDNDKPFGVGAVIRDIRADLRKEEDIRQARDAAEAANRAKSLFLAQVTHEIRTPLNGVVGMVSLLERTALDARQTELAATLRASTDQMMVVVDDVLDFSKIEAGKLALVNAPFDPIALVNSTADLFQPKAFASGVTLSTKLLADTAKQVVGDASRIRQVVTNFVDNAIKFTPRDGSVQIVLNGDPVDSEHCALQIAVVDTGIGLTEQQCARIFDPYVQADDSTSRQFGGTGLGLAIAQQLASMMGGDVSVTSSPGRGSTFALKVTLPCRVDDKDEETKEPAPLSPVSNVRVLVAEDNDINQMVAQQLLEALGCTVDVVGDGQAAIDAVQENEYTLVLMDCRMPGTDGYDATAAIRELPRGKLLPIVAMTASATPGEHQRCLAAGMDAFMTKPITFDRMRSLLAMWLPARISR